MNSTTLGFVQQIRSQISALESATSRLADGVPGSAEPDSALEVARNAFTTLEDFLETQIHAEQEHPIHL